MLLFLIRKFNARQNNQIIRSLVVLFLYGYLNSGGGLDNGSKSGYYRYGFDKYYYHKQ
jgi:hypothetical protein